MPRLILGDCVEWLRRLDSHCIDVTVTSPPYGEIRRYGGHPFTWDVFEEVAAELARVTKPGGVICWVEGDEVVDGGYSGLSWRHALHFQDLGLRIYEEIVTGATGFRFPFPRHYKRSPVHGFVLSKGRPNTVRLLRDRENTMAGSLFKYSERLDDGTVIRRGSDRVVPPYGVRTTVWLYPVGGGSPKGQRHPAPMHRALAHDLISTYSREHELVCDPFAGACTTGEQAVLMDRDFLGYEIHEPYFEMGRRRLWAAMDLARREKLRKIRERLQHPER